MAMMQPGFKMARKSGGIGDQPLAPAAPMPVTANDVKAQYSNQVKSFQDSLPQLKETAYQGALSQSKSNLADSMRNIGSAANSRGLLYGGLKQGADQEATAGAAGALAKKRYDINSALEQQGQSMDEQQLNRLLEAYRGDVQSSQNQYGLDLQRQAAQRGMFGQLAGSAITGGAILAASDERLKKNVKNVDKQVDELLAVIKPKSYEYKDGEKYGEGEHISPMAQDLEKSEIGKSMVKDTPEGKMVDYGKMGGSLFAITAALNNRLKKIEAKS